MWTFGRNEFLLKHGILAFVFAGVAFDYCHLFFSPSILVSSRCKHPVLLYDSIWLFWQNHSFLSLGLGSDLNSWLLSAGVAVCQVGWFVIIIDRRLVWGNQPLPSHLCLLPLPLLHHHRPLHRNLHHFHRHHRPRLPLC